MRTTSLNPNAARDAGQIEQIGTEPFSKENQKQMPIYRAYGFTGKWSGQLPPPTEGDRVKINFNGLGAGTVVNYFSESGWLGIRIKLDKRPDWLIKQDKAAGRDPNRAAMVFGSEITPVF